MSYPLMRTSKYIWRWILHCLLDIHYYFSEILKVTFIYKGG